MDKPVCESNEYFDSIIRMCVTCAGECDIPGESCPEACRGTLCHLICH